MRGTPDGRHCQPSFVAELDRLYRIASTAFHWSDVETKYIVGLVCTSNMKRRVTAWLMASMNRLLPRSLANLANPFIPLRWDVTNTFGGVKQLSLAKFDFGRPDATNDVNPIVPGCTLEGLSGIHRSSSSFLLLTPPSAGFGNHFSFHALLLTLSVALLLVTNSKWLHELLMSVRDRTQQALINGRHLQDLIISTHVAEPWLHIGGRRHTVAHSVNMQSTVPALEELLSRTLDDVTDGTWVYLDPGRFWLKRRFRHLLSRFLLLNHNFWSGA
jgi:hypothetical protein